MTDVADAIRKVTAVMQAELAAGRRSAHIDADDLIDLLLAIADEIDSPFSRHQPDERTHGVR